MDNRLQGTDEPRTMHPGPAIGLSRVLSRHYDRFEIGRERNPWETRPAQPPPRQLLPDHRQRAFPPAGRGRRPHHAAGLAAIRRADRLQGGLCRGRVRRLRGAGGPTRGGTRSRWTAINACLVPAAGFDGQEVLTAEGLGRPGNLHPVQQEMAVRGGSQCGYCTPGFICSMASEFYRPDRTPVPANEHGSADAAADPEHGPNGFDLHALSGNLCRCTGYRPIRDAAYALGQPRENDPLRARCSEPAPAAAPPASPAPRVSSPGRGRSPRRSS